MTIKKSIFHFSAQQWQQYLHSYKPYRARQIRIWLYEQLENDINQMQNLPLSLRQHIDSNFWSQGLTLLSQSRSTLDGSTKYVWQINEAIGDRMRKASFESVLIRKNNRYTACLSTQTGCRVGCIFCQTSKIGQVFNLPAWSIVEQYWQMKKISGVPTIGNIVFMGMGEPMLNYSQVMHAAYRFTEHPGFFLHPKRITISTAGILNRMEIYLRQQQPFRLAISLNTITDADRNYLMPINRKWSVSALLDFAKRYHMQTGKRVTFEYVIISGFNDSPKQAQELAKAVGSLPAKINIIPYNQTQSQFSRPTDEVIDDFIQAYLSSIPKGEKNLSPLTIRRSAGEDIAGACGQLSGSYQSSHLRDT